MKLGNLLLKELKILYLNGLDSMGNVIGTTANLNVSPTSTETYTAWIAFDLFTPGNANINNLFFTILKSLNHFFNKITNTKYISHIYVNKMSKYTR